MKYFVCTDGSKNSREALEFACSFLGSGKKDEVVLASFWEEPNTLMPTSNFDVVVTGLPPVQLMQEQEDEERLRRMNRAQNILEQEKAFLMEKGVPEHNIKLVNSHSTSVREAIIEKAQEEAADLIVVGSRGLGLIKRLLLGSVSSYVVTNSPIPVLVVKPHEQ